MTHFNPDSQLAHFHRKIKQNAITNTDHGTLKWQGVSFDLFKNVSLILCDLSQAQNIHKDSLKSLLSMSKHPSSISSLRIFCLPPAWFPSLCSVQLLILFLVHFFPLMCFSCCEFCPLSHIMAQTIKREREIETLMCSTLSHHRSPVKYVR